QDDRRAPGVGRAGTRGNPNVAGRDTCRVGHRADAGGREEELQSVPTDRRSGIATRAVEFRDVCGRAEGQVVVADGTADINVEIALAAVALAREVEGDSPGLVLEIGRPVVVLRRVEDRAEGDPRFPGFSQPKPSSSSWRCAAQMS